MHSKQAGEWALVPLCDVECLLWNLQTIAGDGAKLFQRGGRITGLFSPLGDLSDPKMLLITEGWATGATLHEESRYPVLCAMNAGNLLPVAKAARATWPDVDLVICADNDRHTKGNPGVTAATAAAKAAGGRLAVPQFADDEPGSDWNDWQALRRTGGRHD